MYRKKFTKQEVQKDNSDKQLCPKTEKKLHGGIYFLTTKKRKRYRIAQPFLNDTAHIRAIAILLKCSMENKKNIL